MFSLERVLTSEPPGEHQFRDSNANTYRVPLDVVSDHQLVLVVGDPGGGKTYLVDTLCKQVESRGTAVKKLNLMGTSEAVILNTRMELDNLPGAGGVLFLDGLDESRAAIASLVADVGLLIESAQRVGVRVVATCRSAEINDSIRHLFDVPTSDSHPDSATGRVFYLAPLARTDVEVACRAANIDAQRFLVETDIAGAQGLASNPFTLELLIQHFQRLGTLAVDRSTLYESTITSLLQRMKPPRALAIRRPIVPDEARRDFAGQLALTLVLSRSRTVTIEIGEGRAALHGRYPVSDPHGKYTSSEWQIAMEDVLDSGLLVRVTHNELAFAHRSLLDYLAAHQLTRLQIHVGLERRLLTLPGITDLLPLELFPIARWLITMSPRFDWVATLEPLRLVQARGQDEVARLRPVLIESLLRDALRWEYSAPYGTSFSGLDCPSLCDLVRAALTHGSDAQRSIALRILADNPERALAPDALALAKDPEVDGHVRQLAIDALVALEARDSLAVIAEGLLHDSLQVGEGTLGAALSACWPIVLSTSDLLCLLVPPRENMFGRYKHFLFEMVDRSSPQDLLEISRWAAAMTLRDAPSRNRGSHRRSWSQRILSDALERLEQPAALEFDEDETALMLLAMQDAEKPVELGLKRLAPENRQSIVLKSIQLGFDSGVDWYDLLGLVEDGVNLVNELDFALLMVLATGDSPEFADIATRVFDPTLAEHRDALERFAGTALGQSLQARLEGANSAKRVETWSARRRRAGARPEQPPAKMDMIDRLRMELSEASNDLRRFWLPYFVLTADVQSGRFRDMSGENYTEFDFYEELPLLDKVRLRKLAEHFLRHVSLEVLPPHEDQGSHSRIHHAAYQILYVAFVGKWSVLDEVTDAGWGSLVDSVIRFPVHFVNGPRDSETKELLLASLLKRVPEAFLARVRVFVDLTVSDPSKPVGLREVARLPDSRIADELIRVLDALSGHERTEVVSALVTARPQSEFADNLLRTAPAEDVSAALSAYLSRDSRDGTTKLLEVIEARPELSAELLRGIAQGERFERRLLGNVSQMIALYRAVFLTFPPTDDPAQGPGAYTVTPRHDVASLRRQLLEAVLAIGTTESYAAVLRLSQDEPSMIDPWELHRAAEALKSNGWPGTEPHVLQSILVEGQKGLIARNPDELLHSVIETLTSICEDLGPPRRLGRYLWAGNRPRSESDISDWYAHELHSRLAGAFIDREVQVSGKPRGSIGDRADIQVAATGPGSEGYAVLIEVKGSWNDEVFTAIDEQLLARYLVSRELTHGVLLVAWFNPESTDWARPPAKAERLTPAELATELGRQAELVEPPRRVAAVVHEVPKE
ncbi:MAG: ATP-binding protein [Microcella sp.]|uniref:NACHT domain-containing protein n=1 Tax=Microcella sp. TaxID=1913979 RepID=UPI0024CBC8E6|nr:hypothetical protein [Microcella sp.]UYN84741.1 MAG: ATP-binding protein [Microcella sp.]